MDDPIFQGLIRDWPAVREQLMGRHGDDDADGVANQAEDDWTPEFVPAYPEWTPCEDRDDPDSWDDPEIVDHPYGDGVP